MRSINSPDTRRTDDLAATFLRTFSEKLGQFAEGGVYKPLRIGKPPPEWLKGEKTYWLLQGGRGSGKTRAACEQFNTMMVAHPRWRGGIIGPTLGDAVESCVTGTSGLLAINPTVRFVQRAGGMILLWPNGSTAKLFGAFTPEDVERLRAGGNRHLDLYDEFATWRKLKETFQNARLGLRLGDHPQAIIATTPKPRRFYRQFRERDDVVITRGTTHDNPHTSPAYRDAVTQEFAGTALAQQELLGEDVDVVPGALWTYDSFRRAQQPADLSRVVVSVDPAVSAGPDSDDTGIVVVGSTTDKRFGVLADLTCHLPVEKWANRVVAAYHDYGADCVVAEVNQGGDLVTSVVRQADPNVPVKAVRAKRGKALRAGPVAMLYEQKRVDHYGVFEELESQMMEWVPDDPTMRSPDRIDALVQGILFLSEASRVIIAAI